MIYEKKRAAFGGMRIGSGKNVIGENLLLCHFVRHKS
jgi:hypothetical protein